MESIILSNYASVVFCIYCHVTFQYFIHSKWICAIVHLVFVFYNTKI
jgi:hypothetical protein